MDDVFATQATFRLKCSKTLWLVTRAGARFKMRVLLSNSPCVNWNAARLVDGFTLRATFTLLLLSETPLYVSYGQDKVGKRTCTWKWRRIVLNTKKSTAGKTTPALTKTSDT
jgi:hypothetical protein